MPNPALEPGDVIEIAYPDGRTEEQEINSISLGLGVDGTLSMTTKSGVGEVSSLRSAVRSTVYTGDTAWRELEGVA